MNRGTQPPIPPAAAPEFPDRNMRWPMPTLLQEVKRDRSSPAFAMEKLDQTTINLLFEQQGTRRDGQSRA